MKSNSAARSEPIRLGDPDQLVRGYARSREGGDHRPIDRRFNKRQPRWLRLIPNWRNILAERLARFLGLRFRRPRPGADCRTTGVANPRPPPSGPANRSSRPFRLRVGVVSTVGNYREHNEDNFYLPAPPTISRSTAATNGHRDYFHRSPSRPRDDPRPQVIRRGRWDGRSTRGREGEPDGRRDHPQGIIEAAEREHHRRVRGEGGPARRSETRSPPPTRRSSACRSSRPSSTAWGRPSCSP